MEVLTYDIQVHKSDSIHHFTCAHAKIVDGRLCIYQSNDLIASYKDWDFHTSNVTKPLGPFDNEYLTEEDRVAITKLALEKDISIWKSKAVGLAKMVVASHKNEDNERKARGIPPRSYRPEPVDLAYEILELSGNDHENI